MNTKMLRGTFRFLLVCLFFMSFGFISPFKGLNKEKQKPAYLVLLYKVCKQFTNEFEKKYNIVSTGPHPSLVGMFKECFDSLECEFAAGRIGTIDEARKICVLGTEALMKKIDESRILHPSFYNDPKRRERIHVDISYLDPTRPSRHGKGLALAFQAKNKIFYYATDEKSNDTIKVLEETYDEACKILKEQGVLK